MELRSLVSLILLVSVVTFVLIVQLGPINLVPNLLPQHALNPKMSSLRLSKSDVQTAKSQHQSIKSKHGQTSGPDDQDDFEQAYPLNQDRPNMITVTKLQNPNLDPVNHPIPEDTQTCPPHTVEAVDFTLVTQGSIDKVWMLDIICQRWHGPLVVVVATKPKSKPWIKPLKGHCSYHLIHVVLMTDRREYPINQIRNIGIAHVVTSHYLYVDIDLWPSADLYQRFQSLKATHPTDLLDPTLALVIPAFQLESHLPRCTAETPTKCKMPRTFQQIVEGSQLNTVQIFHGVGPSHSTTPYKDILSPSPGDVSELLPIRCFDSNRYEPYVLLKKCPFTPVFHEGFTGYGKNKIELIVNLRLAGWRFAALSKSFIIHNPHPPTKAEKTKLQEGHQMEMDTLYDQLRKEWEQVYSAQNRTHLCSHHHHSQTDLPSTDQPIAYSEPTNP